MTIHGFKDEPMLVSGVGRRDQTRPDVGVEYIERIELFTVNRKPMEMPKPFNYAAHD